jgi:hypothetical protein
VTVLVDTDVFTARMRGGSPLAYVIGGVDLDGDGAMEILAKTGFAAVHAFVGFFALRDGELDAVRLEDGRPAEFTVGDFVGKYRRGIACEPASGIVRSYSADHIGAVWEAREVVVTSYRMVGTILEQADRVRIPDDEGAKDYYGLDCGGLPLFPNP